MICCGVESELVRLLNQKHLFFVGKNKISRRHLNTLSESKVNGP